MGFTNCMRYLVKEVTKDDQSTLVDIAPGYVKNVGVITMIIQLTLPKYR